MGPMMLSQDLTQMAGLDEGEKEREREGGAGKQTKNSSVFPAL